MTNQEIFDTVYRHLLKQGRRSTRQRPGNPAGQDPLCVYRAPNGDRCAVGCLIPDDLYSPDMEGLGVLILAAKVPKFLAMFTGKPDTALRLLGRLQVVHDAGQPEVWAANMAMIAKSFGLTIPAMEPVAVPEPEPELVEA